MSMFELMIRPFVECLILVGIHSYLGLHVIRRRVIFVDLALAQIAALGATVGGALGIMHETPEALLYSLVFCLVGAALFAFTRVRHDRIPHEAVIGLVYAISFSIAILVVQKTEGVEHMEDILVGRLLYVSWGDILTALVAYALVGAMHLIYWKRFILISDFPEKAYRQGLNVRLWDFLFYASFGFVITFSTKVAGVLLVFVFLVAPAILASMITDRFGRQLLIGWGVGTLVTVVGLAISAHRSVDLPSGPSVVTFYGVVLGLGAVLVANVRAKRHLWALLWTGVGALGVLAVGFGVYYLGRGLASEGTLAVRMARAMDELATHGSAHSPVAAPADKDGAAAAGLDAFESEEDEFDHICKDIDGGRRGGIVHLVRFLADPETPLFYCEQGLELLRKTAGQDFGFACDAEPAERDKACQAMKAWLEERDQLVEEPLPGRGHRHRHGHGHGHGRGHGRGHGHE
ncbi:MAG: metal ABC transporter permease [Deltaproteobacteria bacterium]|nr:metal ABC transporter permease [Deltaproteobacteria bacterium]